MMSNRLNRLRAGALARLAPASVVVLAALTLTVPCANAAFGVAAFDGQSSDAAGDAYGQAGGHPYAISTEIELNHHEDAQFGFPTPDEPIKDGLVDLPAGLIGNPAAAVKCTSAQLSQIEVNSNEVNSRWCPLASQVGVVTIYSGGFPFTAPVFNMEAPPTVPARFGFKVLRVVVTLDASVRSDRDYGLSVNARDISEALPLTRIDLTIWGIPADPSHDQDRCLNEHAFVETTPLCTGEPGNPVNGPNPAGRNPLPFLTQPTRCTEPGVGLETRLRADSWNNPGVFTESSFISHEPPNFPASPAERGAPVGITGCDLVPFEPSIHVQPTSTTPDSPTGLNVTLSVPTDGLENPAGIAQSELRKAVVSLPEGMAVNPAAADGLGACSQAQVGLASTGDAACPDSSKIGTAEIDTPLLEQPLVGSIYLAAQGDNPFGSLLAVYLVAKGSGVVVKLPGKIEADPLTGRLTTTFDNAPQLPFASLKLSFKGGPRAPLLTPATCGHRTISAQLTGWSGKSVTLSDGYDVACTPGLGEFAPAFAAGTTNPQGGAFSPFTMTLSRADGSQTLSSVRLQMPAGLLGILKGIPLCGEPQAAQGSCGPESLIGHTTVGAGAGSNPFYLGGSVYLTGPYKGAPFGLSIVVPALAGPFNLGTVVVRASIAVNPATAQLTITSDPLPTILQGIPLDLRVVNVTVDRAGFTFNPTDCEPLNVDGTITSTQGAAATLSDRFQAASCAVLRFHPKFSAATQGNGTFAGHGASLTVKIASKSGPARKPGEEEANLRKVDVQLPVALPARLSTLQKACTESQFAANPAGCPAASVVGTATASTPVLATSLGGPAYLVSHGGAAFPDLVLILQGSGITIELDGHTQIKGDATFSRFETVPDAPISSFELRLPEGPHSALAASKHLCAPTSTVTVSKRVTRRVRGRVRRVTVRVRKVVAAPLLMPTTITAQNGAVLRQTTKIAVTGCARTKAHKQKK